jgi:hypothetical protein
MLAATKRRRRGQSLAASKIRSREMPPKLKQVEHYRKDVQRQRDRQKDVEPNVTGIQEIIEIHC